MSLKKKKNIENIINKGSFGNIQIKDSRKKKSQSEKKEIADELKASSIKEGMILYIEGYAKMHRNSLEIKLEKVEPSEKDFDTLLDEQSSPVRTDFSIESERYESMKERYIEIAQRIRRAVMEEQPIYIRHHNDADGICAGMAVEESIENLMERNNINRKNKLYRKSNISPFYDEIDLFRDISKFNDFSKKFGDKSPLLLFLDTASTPENKFALKTLQAFGFNAIIVDHHNPGDIKDGKSEICEFVDLHLNPYLFGWDSQTCGGMLCYELARFIDESFYKPLYPAVAAIGDRCEIIEVDRYIENAAKVYRFLEESEDPKEVLLLRAKVIDYISYFLRLDSGGGVYGKIFSDQNIVDVIGTQVETLYQNKLDSIIPNINSLDFNGICFTEINLEKYTQRGKYPSSGKVLGLAHDYIKKYTKEGLDRGAEQPVFTIGYFDEGIIIRATHPILPVPDLLEELQQDMPDANIDGGGHEQAGSIKFIASYNERVRNYVKEKLKEL